MLYDHRDREIRELVKPLSPAEQKMNAFWAGALEKSLLSPIPDVFRDIRILSPSGRRVSSEGPKFMKVIRFQER